ncbi:uncharacterized protein LOC117903899 [Drosophila subobscura]|uniref:uncharacterized protein LOC117903899 n=1 Tax=Drosophila subobscura TaxID=7241 RepID=UPI00155A4FE8|nr:uncharacterized protein LOC117903899 [Drosophila subobscura]
MSSFNQLGQVVCQLIESVGVPVSYEVVMELMAKMKKRPLTTQERLSVKATLDAALELGFLQQSSNNSYCVLPVTRKTEFELKAHQMDASMPPAIETERNQVTAFRKGNEGKTADKSTGKSRKPLKRLCSKKKTTAGLLEKQKETKDSRWQLFWGFFYNVFPRKGKTAGKATGGVLKRKGKATAGNRKRSSKRPSRKAKVPRGESKCRSRRSSRK